MSEWKYFDGSMQPNPLTIGDKVVCYPNDENLPPGLIVKFDEVDCDYNDELGRAEQYGPYCFVKWPEAPPDALDRFSGHCRITWADYPDGPDTFYFDDLVRITD